MAAVVQYDDAGNSVRADDIDVAVAVPVNPPPPPEAEAKALEILRGTNGNFIAS